MWGLECDVKVMLVLRLVDKVVQKGCGVLNQVILRNNVDLKIYLRAVG